MMRPILVLLVLAAVAMSLPAQEKGYKVVRPDGTVEFTDQPTAGAQEITLPKAQSYEAPVVTPAAAAPAPKAQQGPVYSQLAITAPTPEQEFQNGEGTVGVTVQLEPSLQGRHRLIILLDGREVANNAGTSISLSGVERGSHTLAAEVRDARGSVIQSSAPVIFHMRQHSSLFDAPPPQTPSPVSPAPMMPKAPRAP